MKYPQILSLFISFACLLYSVAVGAQEFATIPKMTSWVVDTTQTLSRVEQSKIHNKLESFQKKKGAQVAVVIVPTTKPETIEGYCLRVAEKWKVGRSGHDDGVILCVAKSDRKLRIEVGYGAEGVIPDARAKQIIESVITPNFKKNLFFNGIDAGTDALTLLLSGQDFSITRDGKEELEQTPLEKQEEEENAFIGFIFIFGIIAFVFHLAIPDDYLWKFGAGGAGVSFLITIFMINFLQALMVAGSFFIVTMFGMQILWAMLSSSGSGGSSSGGGGSSFGGGGGGSFGGGGASGSW